MFVNRAQMYFQFTLDFVFVSFGFMMMQDNKLAFKGFHLPSSGGVGLGPRPMVTHLIIYTVSLDSTESNVNSSV